MSEYVLQAKNITKRFPGVIALKDVSFDVKQGEVLGLIGENGAGKSTLLKVINGVYPNGTYEGEIVLNGKTAHFTGPHNALVEGIGFVPQEINVMNDLTVAENIYVGHLNDATGKKSVSLKQVIAKADEFLKANKFTLNARETVNKLSIGQKQLLMIAKALSWDPSILILDEPTTALSQADCDNLFEVVRHLRDQGRSIIFVTHKLAEIFEMTDRVTILRDGTVINTYEKAEYNNDQIIADMVGRSLSQLYPDRERNIGEEVLRVEGLTVPHDKIMNKNIVEDISFNVRAGEVVGLVGLVGSGRTETVTALFGGYPDATKKVFINGEEVNIREEADAIAHGMNMLTEDRKENGLLLLNDIQFNIVVSNLKKIKKGVFLNKKKEDDVADGFMKKLRIKAPSYKTMAVNLSGGNQQKVVLAKALHSDPKILILDEPTKGIDVGSKQEIYEIMNELLAEGIAIIMISSELPEMLGMCDRFIVLSGGKQVCEMSRDEATQTSLMQACLSV